MVPLLCLMLVELLLVLSQLNYVGWFCTLGCRFLILPKNGVVPLRLNSDILGCFFSFVAGACYWHWFTLLTLIFDICLGYFTGCNGYTSLAPLLLLLLGYNIVAVYPFCLAYGFWFLCCLWVLDSGFFWVLIWIDVVLPCWTVLLGLCWDSLLLLVGAALFICITLWIWLWLYQLLVQPWTLCVPLLALWYFVTCCPCRFLFMLVDELL
jgi:hypothetical protein